ncbi:MAG: hypothetical protein KatS3mg042_0656 [Rhodothermaceae bacterium]|nr:MAG: hypothetical protein KatS3mg042_0656 [Rhodothermaceae bacterium]
MLFFLTYFLLAGGDRFLRRLVETLPLLRHKRNAVAIIRRIEQELSRYFLLVTLVNAGLGGAVAGVLYLLDMPNPLLWGVLAGVLNYVPYLGGLVGILVIGLVALVSFDTLGEALLPPLAYLMLNTMEAYAITPALLGRRLRLNPVAILVSIVFWGWIWGVAGAILAVPLLVSFKIICDNVRALSAIGVFLIDDDRKGCLKRKRHALRILSAWTVYADGAGRSGCQPGPATGRYRVAGRTP